MTKFLPTIILRHRKENLKKCSLTGLETRDDLDFYTYPLKASLPDLTNYIMLDFDGPEISLDDAHFGIFLLDSTWKYEKVMRNAIPDLPKRSLPSNYRTAYPRKQTACNDPDRGLASIEALYLAHKLSGRPYKDLLDHYHWKEEFLKINSCDA
ncbi:MAG: hypothetical protein P0S94_02155 [Simkaniaceae bacterium]|nr:hypothetical protein [Simkaniaceae bacterium]